MKRWYLVLILVVIAGVGFWLAQTVEPESGPASNQVAQGEREQGDRNQAVKTDVGEPSSEDRHEEPEESPGDNKMFSQRVFPFNQIDLEAVKEARRQLDVARQSRASGGLTTQWNQRGPFNVQGRVTAIAVDPRDDDVFYVGAASGGLFRSDDGGDSYVSVFDHSSAIPVGAVALDPSNPDVVFVGTGEVNPGRGSMAYGGNGMWRSDNQGQTWTFLGLHDSGSIGRIVVHPTNSNIIHVAVMGHLWNPSTERGVYRTVDGGANWTRVLYANDTTGCVDLIQRPDDPNVLYASMWTRIRAPEQWIYGGIESTVYRSDDGGVNWSVAENGLPTATADSGRNGLSVCASNPDVMVVIYSHGSNGQFTGLYRTEDGGNNWFRTNDSDLSNSFRSAGWWYGNVALDPENEDIVYTVGFDDYISTDGGDSSARIPGMHVDHHDIAFGVGPNAKTYAGNDGGVYVSTDGVTFTKTTGDLPITQTYRLSASELNTDALWLGTQDNGTNEDLNGNGNFQRIFGGDGFEPLLHLSDANRLWVQYQYGNVFYSGDGGNSFVDARNGLGGRRNWNAPHAIDPGDSETRYFGTNFVYRNDGDTGWTQISGDLTGGEHLGNSGQVDGTLTTINVSPVDSNVIWSGSDDGVVHVTTDGGQNWTDVSAGLPERWITSVRPHPTETGAALVSVSGFRWGEAISHVYRTSDFGQNWVGIDSGLPDMPINDVMYDPENVERLFAASDIGVYQSFNGGMAWQPITSGMPAVVVNDLAYQQATRKLFAGTYGRSIFELPIPERWTTEVEVVVGVEVDGTVTELNVSDNNDFRMRRGNSIASRVVAELRTVSHLEVPSQMQFTLESSVIARGDVTQSVSLFNFDTDQFELVDSRPAARFVDQRTEIIPTGDVSRFVQPGTGAMEARVEYSSSVNRRTITASIDQAFWSVIE